MIATGDKIKKIRKEHKEGQKALADVLCCSIPTICRWERGERSVPDWAVAGVCKHYNISADWLLGLKTERGGLK